MSNSDKIPMTRYVYGICYDGEIVYTGSTKDMTFRWKKYKDEHNTPNNEKKYRIRIHQFMREKGFDNFSHQIIETFEDITRQGIYKYEGMWQNTFEELGFNLLNKLKAGNGTHRDLNSIAYANNRARMNERIQCEFCGAMIARGNIRRHQKGGNCLNSRKVLVS